MGKKLCDKRRKRANSSKEKKYFCDGCGLRSDKKGKLCEPSRNR